MADQNLNEVYADNPRTTIDDDSLVYFVEDPDGTPGDAVIKFQDINKGWMEVTEAWTYNAADAVNVPTDATTRFKKGWGVRFKQGGAFKYMQITSPAATVLTLNGGTDYTVANSAITDIAVTNNPAGAFGFPVEYSWTPTWTNFTIGSGTQVAKFTLRPDRVRGYLKTTLAADSSMGTTPRFSLPVTMASGISFADHVGRATYFDNDAGLLYKAMPHVFNSTEIRIHAFNAGSTYGSFISTSATVPFTWATSDRIQIDFDYRW